MHAFRALFLVQRTPTMSDLFAPLQAGDLRLPNRIVMAPPTRNRAPHAIPNELMQTYYRQRASAGLIISEGTAISHQGQGYAHVPGLYSEEQLAGWKQVTAAVHAAGGRIVTQLWHVGRVSHHLLQPQQMVPVGPSPIAAKTKTYLIDDATGKGQFVPTSVPRALRQEELPGIVHSFAVAAREAVATAGFDGVELHAANGYLLDQFLKNGANRRADDYGGSIENRARLTLECTRLVADAVGGGKVGIRISPVTPANDITDTDPQPLFEYLMRQLAPLGLSYIHVIEGATGGAREIADRPFDYHALKDAYRQAGGRGAWIVNNGYDKPLAEQAVHSGYADAVAFGKAFIANPDLVRRLAEDLPWNSWKTESFYGGNAEGYTDYPLAK